MRLRSRLELWSISELENSVPEINYVTNVTTVLNETAASRWGSRFVQVRENNSRKKRKSQLADCRLRPQIDATKEDPSLPGLSMCMSKTAAFESGPGPPRSKTKSKRQPHKSSLLTLRKDIVQSRWQIATRSMKFS